MKQKLMVKKKSNYMLIVVSIVLLLGLGILAFSSSPAYADYSVQGFGYAEQHMCAKPYVGHATDVNSGVGAEGDATVTITSVTYYWFHMAISYHIAWDNGSTGSGYVQCY